MPVLAACCPRCRPTARLIGPPPSRHATQGAKPAPFLVAVGIGLALRFLVPIPVGISVQAWTLLSIFVSTIAGGVAWLGAWVWVWRGRGVGGCVGAAAGCAGFKAMGTKSKDIAPCSQRVFARSRTATGALPGRCQPRPALQPLTAPLLWAPLLSVSLHCLFTYRFLGCTPPRTRAAAGLVLEPLPVGAWAFMAVTTAIATKTLTFAQARQLAAARPPTTTAHARLPWPRSLPLDSMLSAPGLLSAGLGARSASPG